MQDRPYICNVYFTMPWFTSHCGCTLSYNPFKSKIFKESYNGLFSTIDLRDDVDLFILRKFRIIS